MEILGDQARLAACRKLVAENLETVLAARRRSELAVC